MKNMTPDAIVKAVGGRIAGHTDNKTMFTEITSVTTDSRKVTCGCLFAALRGKNSDGHAYMAQAARSGALAVLAEEAPEEIGIPVILTADTGKALKDLAAYYLDQLQIPTVGIIGSAGKTSTKEMTAQVLAQKYRVLKTEGNFNNELGVPLTIFRIRDEDEIAVIEMGINHFGEMDRLGRVVRPDSVIMTNIGTAHLEFLGSREGILQAKSEVFAHMGPDSCAILNADDDMLASVKEVQGNIPVRYGIEDPNADVRAEEVISLGLEGMRFVLCMDGLREEVVVPSPGLHSVHNALAGAACGRRYGLTIEQIAEGIRHYQGLPGRERVIRTEKYTVIDDAYNANPSSMMESLKTLQSAQGRRVAILGDMGELGEQASGLHREVGRFAAGLDLDLLCCAGDLGKEIAEGAEEAESGKAEVCAYPDRDTLLAALPDLIRAGDVILVKASHFMGFERVVTVLTEQGY
ncbi:MAG: UDP-N-acetylmuramoyl-tripeptide--D-alanyl-D-alanine ligase [Eubacterium sp.]|nr:UDP-N-acetylmuramoyl-tripeptide--D-alanyl-D-alanine ligase [Eubacterium sp.]